MEVYLLRSYAPIRYRLTKDRASSLLRCIKHASSQWQSSAIDSELNWLVQVDDSIHEIFISDDYCSLIMRDTSTGQQRAYDLGLRVSYLLYPIPSRRLLVLMCQDKRHENTGIAMFDINTGSIRFVANVIGELSMSVTVIDTHRDELILITSTSLLAVCMTRPNTRMIAKANASAGVLLGRVAILYNKDDKRLMGKNIVTGSKVSQLNISKLDIGRFVCIKRNNNHAIIYFQGHNTPLYDDGNITLKAYAYQPTLGKSIDRCSIKCRSFECLNIAGSQLSLRSIDMSAVVYQDIDLSVYIALHTIIDDSIMSHTIKLYEAGAVQSIKIVMVRRFTHKLAAVYVIDEYDVCNAENVCELRLKL